MKKGLIALILGTIIIGGGTVGVNALSNNDFRKEIENKSYSDDIDDKLEDEMERKALEEIKDRLGIKDNEWRTYDELEDIIENKLGIEDIEDLIEKELGLDNNDDIDDID
ncbi:hypothetical protein [Clostridium chauvoei]|uniref:Uncharacterized protein n=2 Tax=Clostridium chauvoei TaxID=46867 RepID=A0ABD4RIX9_9CLOT|nr:hypothetical protein [Clostridium chauvoei]ATD55311.1 hypothetical protein BTM20_08705 [Clostridium chauvoei]ATD57014.1 hypothetical protein BTM21_04335 [Clostridium chauvoei]MBX7280823.1 hypothetical protein [Clostridium chauvoei]MBX7283306.1 hypothetical protein [Clostridium chauvoei]MBX7285780.1 hypothetical protein [Clostridium chauvoei]